MPLYMKMSQNINKTTRHLKFRYISMFTIENKYHQESTLSIYIPMVTPRRINVDSLSILRRYMEYQILTNFHVISTYFFDVISPIKKSTSSSHTFFDLTSMVEKSTLFLLTFSM